MRLLLTVLLFGLLATTAHALPTLPDPLPPVADNPADALLDVPIEDSATTTPPSATSAPSPAWSR